jgi:hypothetical protein
MRTRPFSGNSHQLRKHTVHRVRMDERDLEPEQSGSRLHIDQLHTLLGQAIQLAVQIAHLVGDMVHSRTAIGDELADGRVVAECAQELDAAPANANGHRFDTLGRHRLAMLQLCAENRSVRLDRLLQVLDRHAQVMNPLRLHREGDATEEG